MARRGWLAPVPVLCIGNATVGGAGKTTVTLDLVRRLTVRGVAVHVLSRGYAGTARGPVRVATGDDVAAAGDEALLLAAAGPTWTGGDRAASARQAIAAGADVLVMDDGLQNPTLAKTMSLLVVDGESGFGNGAVVPVGPLREPVAAAAARCRAAILIGADKTEGLARLPADLPVLRADLMQQEADIAALEGRPVFAFAGIARPEKFFAGLERAGVNVVGRAPFADHHLFSAAELTRLRQRATTSDAVLVTTPKDAVRLPAGFDAHVVGVRLEFRDEAAVEALLDELVGARDQPARGPDPPREAAARERSDGPV